MEIIIFVISLLISLVCFMALWKLYDIYFKNEKAYKNQHATHLNYNKWQSSVNTDIIKQEKPVFPECLTVLGFNEWPNDFSEIKGQFHKLAKQKHPDAGGSAKEFEEINRAYKEAQELEKYKS